jgi:hypothetical protein
MNQFDCDCDTDTEQCGHARLNGYTRKYSTVYATLTHCAILSGQADGHVCAPFHGRGVSNREELMKRNIIWRVVIGLLVVGIFPCALCGKGFEKSYMFDLVNWDKETTHLREPEGMVPFKLFSARAQDEKDLDKLYREQLLPMLQKERAALHVILKGIDGRLGGDQLADEEMTTLANEAHDAYFASVERILQFVRDWNQSDENPYHRSKALAVAGFFARQPYAANPIQKTWTSSSSQSSSRTVDTPTGSVTKTRTSTTSASVSVGVDPVGAIVGLTGLFGKKKKAPPEPPYLAGIRLVIDAANDLGDLDEKDNKNSGRLLAELKRYEEATGSGKEKSRKRLLPLLATASSQNGVLRRQAAALPAQVDKALAGGADNLRRVGELLRSLSPLATSLESACQGVEAGIGAVRQALTGSADLQPPLAGFTKALTERERLAGEVQDQGYEVSRQVDY